MVFPKNSDPIHYEPPLSGETDPKTERAFKRKGKRDPAEIGIRCQQPGNCRRPFHKPTHGQDPSLQHLQKNLRDQPVAGHFVGGTKSFKCQNSISAGGMTRAGNFPALVVFQRVSSRGFERFDRSGRFVAALPPSKRKKTAERLLRGCPAVLTAIDRLVLPAAALSF